MQTFVAALDTMFGGFRERADYTYQLLRAPGTAFLVVAAPEPDALREASYFVERLAQERHAAGRAGAQPGAPLAGAPRLSAARSLAAAETLQDTGRAPAGRRPRCGCTPSGCSRCRARQRLAEHFTAAHPAVPVAEIPAQPEDVHDLAGPARIGDGLRRPANAGLRKPYGH